MIKASLLVALAALGAAASAQSVVYNTLGGDTTLYDGPGSGLSGDNVFFPTLASGQSYVVTDLSFVAFASEAGTYSAPLTISFFNTVTGSGLGSDPAFSDLAATIQFNIAGFDAPTAGSGALITLSGLDIPLASPSAFGYGVQFQFGTATSTNGGTGSLSTGYSTAGSSIAGSSYSEGMYIDAADANGALSSDEYFVLGDSPAYQNVAMSLSARVVQATPEPSAMAALGLGVVALLRRRRA